MARYKVAQDVEADDKLIGPFSFRQFMYLVIAVMAGGLAYLLSRVFVPLLIIPVPVVVLFLALALPLRKDQPMEVYLAALVSFYLKPRKRIWQPDGVESMITITAPKVDEEQLTKNITGSEAQQRLAYLANLADTRGWSVRNVTAPELNTSMVSDVYNEAQSYPDKFDEDSEVAQSFNAMIDKADQARREQMVAKLQKPTTQSSTQPQQASNLSAQFNDGPAPRFSPYPDKMRQHVVRPMTDQTTQQAAPAQSTQVAPSQPTQTATQQPSAQSPNPNPPQSAADPAQPQVAADDDDDTTSSKPVSPDIINLANNKDLSIETIAREAHRIEQKSLDEEKEVVISLR